MKRQRWCDRPGMSPVLHKLFADAGTVSKRFAPRPRGQTRHRGGGSSARPPRNSAGGSTRQSHSGIPRTGALSPKEQWLPRSIGAGGDQPCASRPRKEGPAFDLPIALGLLVASGQLDRPKLDGLWCAGELGLDGSLRPCRGVIALADLAMQQGTGPCRAPCQCD